MQEPRRKQAFDLVTGARRAALDNGFAAEFSPEVLAEAAALSARRGPAVALPAGARDLRGLLWSSIDNDDSRDLDQIEVAERLPGGDVKVLIAIADVDSLVARGSAIDRHAADVTSSLYTGAAVFPMLPEVLSTDLTSLGEGDERLAIVVEMRVDGDGQIVGSDVYRALVQNRAKLAYDSVGAWLGGEAGPPPKVLATPGLEAQLRVQDGAARALKRHRHERGALDLETIEARAVTQGGQVVGLTVTLKSHARDVIEDFMIAANGVMARFLDEHGFSSIRRVVRAPERWSRIVILAQGLGETLPEAPSSLALAGFLERRRAAAPDAFPDLSLSVVKLMGPGEYALERAGQPHDGHFGLAVHDYTHSTAPNRRFADLVTQRLVKAASSGAASPYSEGELAAIADRCTLKENDARKVERVTRKQAAALFLHARIGESFDAIITGATPKGTFARLLAPPAEGRIVRGEQGLDVGDHVRLRLVDTSPAKGFIDLARD